MTIFNEETFSLKSGLQKGPRKTEHGLCDRGSLLELEGVIKINSDGFSFFSFSK